MRRFPLQCFQHIEGLLPFPLVDVEGVLLQTGLEGTSFKEFYAVEDADGLVGLAARLVEFHKLVEDIGTTSLQLRKTLDDRNGPFIVVPGQIGGGQRLHVARIAIVKLCGTVQHGSAEAVFVQIELKTAQLVNGFRVSGVDGEAIAEKVVGLAQASGQLLLDALLIKAGEAASLGSRELSLHGRRGRLALAASLHRQCPQEQTDNCTNAENEPSHPCTPPIRPYVRIRPHRAPSRRARRPPPVRAVRGGQ